MAFSYVQYTGNGTTTNYAFSFPYLSQSHIKVRVNGVITSYTFLNSSTVTISPAPAAGAIIDIRRETPKDQAPVNFADGSVLLEEDLDLLAAFNLYTAQETDDLAGDSIAKDTLGVFQADNRRIANVADPVDAQDAVNKRFFEGTFLPQLQSQVAAATTQATNAAGSATAAAGSATNAANSASAASTSATNAAGSATAASGSASAASTSASNAAGSASAAATSATNAGNSAQSAANASSSASSSAALALSSQNSAQSWSDAASSSASAAAGSATTATNQANAAAASAANALANRNDAANSATAASNSASAAATSATQSASSATAAATSAAQANAVSLGNEPVRHTVRPSLLLDFANTKRLDPRITFTRTTTASFYDGKTVAKAEENLLLRSQEFDQSPWVPAATTVVANTAGTTAPDGTSTAEKIEETTSSSAHNVNQGVTLLNVPYTLSIYLKAAERGFALVSLGTNVAVSVDLSTGSATSAVGSPSNIASVNSGNGWWRVSFTFTIAAGSNNVNIYSSTDGVWANRSFAGTAGSGIYVWGVQLEQRSSVTAYTPTTTQPITNYIPALQTAAAGVARFDHNPVTGESLGLLIEEQRTNLLQRSEEFDNAYWTKTEASVVANTIVAPDGTLTADKFVENATSNGHQFYNGTSVAFTSGTSYTASIYAKASGSRYLRISFGSSAFPSTSRRAIFNPANGTVVSNEGGTTASVVNVGNGWYRFILTASANSTTNSNVFFDLTDQSSTTPYTGDGYSGIYIWGAQLEERPNATSYIKTEGSTVTRNADVLEMTGTNFSSWYRADKFSVYAEYERIVSNPNRGNTVFTMSVGTSTSDLMILDVGDFYGRTPAAEQFIISLGTINVGSFYKAAGAYEVNNVQAALNSTLQTADTSAVLSSFNRARIGQDNGPNGNTLNGHLRKLAYYPARLSNTELAALTTV